MIRWNRVLGERRAPPIRARSASEGAYAAGTDARGIECEKGFSHQRMLTPVACYYRAAPAG